MSDSDPILYVGGAGLLLQMDAPDVFNDDGEPYDFLARTNRLAPQGLGAESIYTTAFVALTFMEPFSIRVTPVLDGIPDYDESGEISNSQELAERQTHVFEVPFSKEQVSSSGRKSRFFFRGTWWQLEFGMPCPPEMGGSFIVEGASIETEQVTR